jgi:hypothetical protein
MIKGIDDLTIFPIGPAKVLTYPTDYDISTVCFVWLIVYLMMLFQ